MTSQSERISVRKLDEMDAAQYTCEFCRRDFEPAKPGVAPRFELFELLVESRYQQPVSRFLCCLCLSVLQTEVNAAVETVS